MAKMADGGKLFAAGPCWACKRVFTFDPDLVPSIPIDPANNLPADLGGDPAACIRQPLCADCVSLANADRTASGEPLIRVLDGAYPFGG
jgi:hypothetical protein